MERVRAEIDQHKAKAKTEDANGTPKLEPKTTDDPLAQKPANPPEPGSSDTNGTGSEKDSGSGLANTGAAEPPDHSMDNGRPTTKADD